jgi:hypothetical protein
MVASIVLWHPNVKDAPECSSVDQQAQHTTLMMLHLTSTTTNIYHMLAVCRMDTGKIW